MTGSFLHRKSQSIFTFLMNTQKNIRAPEKLALDCHLEGIIRKSNHSSTSNRTAFSLETQDLSQMRQGLLPGSGICLKGIMGAEKTCYEGFIV